MSESTSREIPSSADHDQYEYSPLSGSDEIRCLILECGSGDEPLACQLRHIKLGEGLPFEAISYVWGSRDMSHSILCNGRRLDITANLHQSLRQARLRTTERVLWADSICINQYDNAERSHQVRLMGRIYSQAKRVIVTLGQNDLSDLHSEPAASVIRQTNDMVQQTLETLNGGWDTFPYPDDDDPLLSDPRWQAVGWLTAQPWFRRGWVVQEAGLASEASILWGHNEIIWVNLMRTYNWISNRAEQTQAQYQIWISTLHIDLFDLRFADETKTLILQRSFVMYDTLDVLDASRRLELEDDRDHVYAFLTLPQAERLLEGLDISYEKSALDVYRNVAMWYINKYQDLVFLQYVGHNEESLRSDFPSWIPHWHISHYYGNLGWTNAPCINSHVHGNITALVTQNNILDTRGVVFDRIDFTSHIFGDDFDISPEELALVWASFSQYRHRSAYGTFSPVLAFYQTITAGSGPPGVELGSTAMRANDAAYMLRLMGGATLSDEPGLGTFQSLAQDGDIHKIHASIMRVIYNRKVVLTERGYFGVVPGLAKEGDVCGVIFGTKTPFILRRTARGEHYKLIGETFMASARSLDDNTEYPYRLGAGPDANEDWLEWGLEEQDIFLC